MDELEDGFGTRCRWQPGRSRPAKLTGGSGGDTVTVTRPLLPSHRQCSVQFHVIHSIAGGTGSGVGCLVSELIAELYPTCRIHHIVWPFRHGEVVTQWYNTVLSISALRDTADSVHLMSNDAFVKQLSMHVQGGDAASLVLLL